MICEKRGNTTGIMRRISTTFPQMVAGVFCWATIPIRKMGYVCVCMSVSVYV